jgi:hypothetical protein
VEFFRTQYHTSCNRRSCGRFWHEFNRFRGKKRGRGERKRERERGERREKERVRKKREEGKREFFRTHCHTSCNGRSCGRFWHELTDSDKKRGERWQRKREESKKKESGERGRRERKRGKLDLGHNVTQAEIEDLVADLTWIQQTQR